MIESYRAWILRPDGKLQSLNYEGVWETDTFDAVCDHGCEAGYCIEHHNCSCGIYSGKTMKWLLANVGFNPNWVYGKVLNWGLVKEHQNGYRSQHSTISVLFVADLVLMDKLSKIYPEIEFALPPPELIAANDDSSRSDRSDRAYQARIKREAERKQREAELKQQYPAGFAGEQQRVQLLLKNATKQDIVAFAKQYAASKEWAERCWAAKVENSSKAKPGDFVFEAGKTTRPMVWVGSERPAGWQASRRYGIDSSGMLRRFINVRRWDEEPGEWLIERRRSIEEWE